MVRKTYPPEQVINKLREAEVFIRQGATIVEASKKIGVAEPSDYLPRSKRQNLHIITSVSLRRGQTLLSVPVLSLTWRESPRKPRH